MGRGGWMKIIAFLVAAVTASCGGTGGDSSGSGQPFVFQTRGRLNLIAQLVTDDPTVLRIIATLLDPQGNPFRNQRVTFEAEFPDATIVPANTKENAIVSLACLPQPSNGNATRCTNRGASVTDDLGQAQVTLIAGLTTGRMRLTAEAPANLNISSAISVQITNQGFIGGTALAILPTSLIFINPLVKPGTDGTMTTFFAVGGTPPFKWDNTNKDLARIDPQGIQNIQANYTLTGPIPTDKEEALKDTVILTDSTGAQVTAPVTVIFADCTLQLSATAITFDQARPGDTLDIKITNGVPPFTVSNTFPPAGKVSVTDDGTITYTIPDPVFSATDTVIVRDSRGCVGTFTVTITPATVKTLTLTANPASISGVTGGTVTITAFAFDIDNQPFEGVTLIFTTDGGSLNPISAKTDANGKAIPPVILTIPAGTTATSVKVTATTQDGKTATVTITVQ